MQDAYELIADYCDKQYPRESYHSGLQPPIDIIANHLPKSGLARILDLCCKRGRALSLVSSDDKYVLYSVDRNAKLLRRAQRRFGESINAIKADSVNFLQKLKIYWDGEIFHCVTMLGTSISLFNAFYRKIIYNQICQVLTPRGLFTCDTMPPVTFEQGSNMLLDLAGKNAPYYMQTVYVVKTNQGQDNGNFQLSEVGVYNLNTVDIALELIAAGFDSVQQLMLVLSSPISWCLNWRRSLFCAYH